MIDLHTHSTASDGSLSPSELITLAVKTGLKAIALTDHNTVDGLGEFLTAAENQPIRAIAGAEFSTVHNSDELHIVALGINKEHFAEITELMKKSLEEKKKSNILLIENLRKAGYGIDKEKILSGHKNVNRAHIAVELVNNGYFNTPKEAFDNILKEEFGLYVPAKKLSSAEIIRFIRSIGAVPVWAHPLLDMDEEGVDKTLAELIPEGLAAIEVYYSSYSPEETKAALSLSEKHGIKISGGSDFHGSAKPHISLGSGKGSLTVPDSVLDLLL